MRPTLSRPWAALLLSLLACIPFSLATAAATDATDSGPRTPSAPLEPRALADEATIFVSWRAPADTADLPEEELRYDVIRNGTEGWRLVAVHLSERVFRDVNVTPGRVYEYAVRARHPAVFENFSTSEVVSAVPERVRTSVALRTDPAFPHPGDLVTFVAVPEWNPHTSDVYEFEVRDGAQTYRASGRPPSFEHVFTDADAARSVAVRVTRAEFDVVANATLEAIALHDVVPVIEARADGLRIQLAGSAPTDPAPEDLTYQWSLGDGAVVDGASATHMYARRGTYSLALVATHASGASGRTMMDVEVNAPPSARFHLDVNGLAVRGVAERETDGGWLESGAWDWGDGTTSVGLVDEHVYRAPGAYDVRFEALDDRGARNATTQRVTVEAPPIEPVVEEASDLRAADGATIPGAGTVFALAGLTLGALASSAWARRRAGRP